MPAIPKYNFDSRESLSGNIKVTPIPIEIPVETRPIIQQSHKPGPYVAVINSTLLRTSTNPGGITRFHWSRAILLIFLVLAFLVIMSNWGLSKLMGRQRERFNQWQEYSEVDHELEELEESPDVEHEEPESGKLESRQTCIFEDVPTSGKLDEWTKSKLDVLY
jgi:hypothetical protein